MRHFWAKLGWLFQRSTKEDELQQELAFHLEAEAEERQALGLSSEEAALAARRELGNVTRVREETRAAWGWTLVEQLFQDLRYAFRTLTAQRTFTVMVVLSLALGIGANTSIYSFVEAILLRYLPVPEPQNLVVMKWRARSFPSVASKGFSTSGGTFRHPQGGMIGSEFPYPALDLFQGNHEILASAFAYYQASHLNVNADGQTESLDGQYVSGDYFHGMGVPPAAGRLLLASDDQAGAPAVVVLNYRYSRRLFGDAANAVGRSIRINEVPFVVAGVTPPEFYGAEPESIPDLWLPAHAALLTAKPIIVKSVAQQFIEPNFYFVQMMGRLQPGVSLAHAQAVLGPRFRQFAESTAKTDRERSDMPTLVVQGGGGGLDSLRHRYSKPLYVLMAMAGLILLIACANITNLLLARAIARRREIAVRLSMGAGRSRVIRQLLTESLLLACMGGAAGVAVAFWGIDFLTLLMGNGRDGFTLHAALNANVLGATLLLSVLVGLLFGLTPALQATRIDLVPILKEAQTGGASRETRHAFARMSLRHILVGGQITLSLVLLIGAGLFGRTLSNLHSINLGFNRENVLLFTINPRSAGYEGPMMNQFYLNLRARLQEIPGVRSATLSERPLGSGSGTSVPVTIPGAAPISPISSPFGPAVRAGLFGVGPGFFSTMQIPIVAGREFDEHSESISPPPAVINQALARAFGLDNPIGRIVNFGGQSCQVVGVVGDAVFLTIKDERRPMLYMPSLGERPPSQETYAVRAAGNPLGQTRAVREVVRQMDSRLAVSEVTTQAARIDQAISQEITLARLGVLFAVVALVIACVGLYGTVAFHVTRRTAEIGIRMALGARRKGIVWLVMREVLVLAILGLAAGVGIAAAGSRFVASFLYGITPNDPLAIAGAIVTLLAAALMAGLVPARRASRIDPMVALRHE